MSEKEEIAEEKEEIAETTGKEIENDVDFTTLFKDISEVLKAQGEEINSLKKQLSELTPKIEPISSEVFNDFKHEITDILQSYNRTVNTNSEQTINFEDSQMNILNRRF